MTVIVIVKKTVSLTMPSEDNLIQYNFHKLKQY